MNKEEYTEFLNRMKANSEAKGIRAIPVTEERVQRSFDALNGLTAETDGISIRDYLMGFSIMEALQIAAQESH